MGFAVPAGEGFFLTAFDGAAEPCTDKSPSTLAQDGPDRLIRITHSIPNLTQGITFLVHGENDTGFFRRKLVPKWNPSGKFTAEQYRANYGRRASNGVGNVLQGVAFAAQGENARIFLVPLHILIRPDKIIPVFREAQPTRRPQLWLADDGLCKPITVPSARPDRPSLNYPMYQLA
jgi:hypothetical protein